MADSLGVSYSLCFFYGPISRLGFINPHYISKDTVLFILWGIFCIASLIFMYCMTDKEAKRRETLSLLVILALSYYIHKYLIVFVSFMWLLILIGINGGIGL